VRAGRGEDGAAGVVEQLRAEGFAAFAHPVDLAETGRWYRVFVGGYPTLEAAREALAGLDTARFPDAYIRKLPAGVAPGAAPPAPPTAAATFPYGYQVSSTRQPAQALEVGQNLAARGFAAYLGTSRLPDGTLWHHVFVGAFATLEDARPLRELLAGAGYAEAFLIPVAYTLTLRPPDPAAGPADPAGRLQAMGHLVYRLPGDGDQVWRVGGYQERRDAEEALEGLTAAGFAAEVTPR
jgi:cell division protein FtsN